MFGNDSILRANLPTGHRHFRGAGPTTTSFEWLTRAIMCRIVSHDEVGQTLCEEIAKNRPDYTPEQFVGYLLGLADRLEGFGDEYGQARQLLERILTERALVTAQTVRLLLSASSTMMSREQPLEAFVRAWVAYRAAGYVPGDAKSTIQQESVVNLAQIMSTIVVSPLALDAARQMVDGL